MVTTGGEKSDFHLMLWTKEILNKFVNSRKLHVRVAKSRFSKIELSRKFRVTRWLATRFLPSLESGLPYSPIRDEFREWMRLFWFPKTKHLSLIAYFGQRTSQGSLMQALILSNAVYFKTDEFKRKCLHQSFFIPFLHSFPQSKRCLRVRTTPALKRACSLQTVASYHWMPYSHQFSLCRPISTQDSSHRFILTLQISEKKVFVITTTVRRVWININIRK